MTTIFFDPIKPISSKISLELEESKPITQVDREKGLAYRARARVRARARMGQRGPLPTAFIYIVLFHYLNIPLNLRQYSMVQKNLLVEVDLQGKLCLVENIQQLDLLKRLNLLMPDIHLTFRNQNNSSKLLLNTKQSGEAPAAPFGHGHALGHGHDTPTLFPLSSICNQNALNLLWGC